MKSLPENETDLNESKVENRYKKDRKYCGKRKKIAGYKLFLLFPKCIQRSNHPLGLWNLRLCGMG